MLRSNRSGATYPTYISSPKSIVVVRKQPEIEQAYFDDHYRPVLGGCECHSDQLDAFPRGTIGYTVYDDRHDQYGWVTAGHVVGRKNGVDVQQPDLFDEIGHSDRYLAEGYGDAAVIKKNSALLKPSIGDRFQQPC
ncbi:hypothetical protein [Halobaculum litoreum]|uniref:hypothetical protein n=1 Tax=Halobaculum litoreum TaxID=3031998 RepID=UPI0024C37801|nr:hypothetical protein [Halobaculum sp. DT92]